MWLVLAIAKKFALSELRSDIGALAADVRLGKTLLPCHADMVAKYLRYIP